MRMVELLRSNGVTPVIVFDGCKLPMKSQEEENRAAYVTFIAGSCFVHIK